MHYEPGDALNAERIAASAMRIRSVRVIHGTGSHRRQACRLERDAYCVIEKPFRYIEQRVVKKTK